MTWILYSVQTRSGFALMPGLNLIQKALLQINYCKCGPIPIMDAANRVAEWLSLTEHQRSVKHQKGYMLFRDLVNQAVTRLIQQNRLILTDYGLITPAASESLYNYHIYSMHFYILCTLNFQQNSRFIGFLHYSGNSSDRQVFPTLLHLVN